MTELTRYHKIPQFRNVLKLLRHMDIKSTVYHGTVKLHGTNAAIKFELIEYHDEVNIKVSFQSRNRVLTVGDDNAGFLAHMNTLSAEDFIKIIPKEYRLEKEVVIYGEWCGGNIQKGIGISSMPKTFIIFDVKINDEFKAPHIVRTFGEGMGKFNIRNIYDYNEWFFKVDVDQPLDAQELFTRLTLKVEAKCPVAAEHGFDGIGEGIVWKPLSATLRQHGDLCFKTKGSKHSNSKVRVIAAPTPEQLAKETAVADFVEYALTEERLKQGIDQFHQEGVMFLDKGNTGKFLQWIMKDIWEEEIDVIETNSLTRKEINSKMGVKARSWFFTFLDKMEGLG